MHPHRLILVVYTVSPKNYGASEETYREKISRTHEIASCYHEIEC